MGREGSWVYKIIPIFLVPNRHGMGGLISISDKVRKYELFVFLMASLMALQIKTKLTIPSKPGVVCPGLSSKSVLPFITVYDRFCRINVSLCWSDSYQSSIRHGPTLPFMTVQICLGHLHPIWADSLQFLIRNGPTLPLLTVMVRAYL